MLESPWATDGRGAPMQARVAFWSCLITAIILLPFGIFRLLVGDYFHALVDVVIMVILLGGAVQIWRTGSARFTGFALSIMATLGVLALMLTIETPSGIPYVSYWLFPTVAGYFVMLPRRSALIMLAVLILLLALLSPLLAPGAWMEQSALIGALSLVGLFAIGFSLIESQRSALEGLVLRDPLTGIGNRLALNEALIQAEERMSRSGQPTALIVLDVDHFKSVNDRHGHRAGDQVLIRMGEILKHRTRKTDACFRMGGEEFVILIPDGQVHEAGTLARSLQDLVRQELRVQDQIITASFGCSELRPGEASQDSLARADAAMYRAKQLGRDRIEFEEGYLPPDDGDSPHPETGTAESGMVSK